MSQFNTISGDSKTRFAPVTAIERQSTGQSAETPAAPALPHGAVADLAYAKYVRSGCQEGRSEQNWYEAEAELRLSALERPHAPKTPVEASLDMSSEGAGGAIGNDAPATPPALQTSGSTVVTTRRREGTKLPPVNG